MWFIEPAQLWLFIFILPRKARSEQVVGHGRCARRVSRPRHLAFMQDFEGTLDKADADGDSTFVRKINDAASPTSLASLLRSLNNLLRADRLEDVLRPLESLPLSISLFPRSL